MAALKGAKRTQAKATKKLASKRTTGGQGNKVQVVVIGDVYWDSVAIHQTPGLLLCDRPPGGSLLQPLLCYTSKNQLQVIRSTYPNGHPTTQMKDLGISEEPK